MPKAALLLVALALGLIGLTLGLRAQGNTDLMLVLLTLSLGAPVAWLWVDRGKKQNALLAMKEEALRAELMLLKQQISPHFFFNTLNNLYGLAVAGSEQTPELILRLSELMRFTLYQGQKEVVSLGDEVTYLENYLALQRIRFRELDDRGFSFDVEDEGLPIAPLMFIIPLENAFKHGAQALATGAWMKGSLVEKGKRGTLTVENGYDPKRRGEPGLGLANLRRRLALLYPGRHALQVEAEGELFRLTLSVEVP